MESDAYPGWFYSNFLQLYGERYTGSVGFHHSEPETELFGQLLAMQELDRRLFAERAGDISTLIRQSIDAGYYVRLALDQYYMQYRTPYSGAYVLKDALVYGYDRANETFHLCTVNKNGVFERPVVSARHVEAAFAHAKPRHPQEGNVRLLKPKEEARDSLSTGRVKSMLTDYVDGCCRTAPSNRGDSREGRSYVFGIELAGMLAEHLDQVERREKEVKLPYFQIWLEHKQIMMSRLTYLRERGCWANADYERAYADILKQAETVRRIVLRYMWTREAKAMEKAKAKLIETVRDEKSCLTGVVHHL